MTQAQFASLHFTTDAFAPAERVAAWRELYGHCFVEVDFEPAETDRFSGEARMVAHPALGFGSVSVAQTRFSKPRSLINSDDLVLVTLESGR